MNLQKRTLVSTKQCTCWVRSESRRQGCVQEIPYAIALARKKSLQDHSRNRQEAAKIVDFFENLAFALSNGVDTRWWEVE